MPTRGKNAQRGHFVFSCKLPVDIIKQRRSVAIHCCQGPCCSGNDTSTTQREICQVVRRMANIRATNGLEEVPHTKGLVQRSCPCEAALGRFSYPGHAGAEFGISPGCATVPAACAAQRCFRRTRVCCEPFAWMNLKSSLLDEVDWPTPTAAGRGGEGLPRKRRCTCHPAHPREVQLAGDVTCMLSKHISPVPFYALSDDKESSLSQRMLARSIPPANSCVRCALYRRDVGGVLSISEPVTITGNSALYAGVCPGVDDPVSCYEIHDLYVRASSPPRGCG